MMIMICLSPDGAEVFNNFFELALMGKFGESIDQVGYGYYAEHIYFPVNGALPGTYQFFVHPFLTMKKSTDGL